MRAVVVQTVAGRPRVRVIDTDLPEPGLAQLRIKVHAATLNRTDAMMAAGAFGSIPPGQHRGLGWDVAGIVDAVGPLVAIPIGTPVVALAQGPIEPLKAQAEYVVVNAHAVAEAPNGVNPAHAATIPLNALTAAQGLELLGLQPGQSVLVTGAAGAVGAYAVQLATHQGLKVVAVAGARDQDFVTSELGASRFISRSRGDQGPLRGAASKEVDGVLDAVPLGGVAMGALRHGGSYVTVDPRPEVLPVAERAIRRRTVIVAGDAARLSTLSDLAAAGLLTTRVALTYPLERAAQAYERFAQGGLRGRIVLTV